MLRTAPKMRWVKGVAFRVVVCCIVPETEGGFPKAAGIAHRSLTPWVLICSTAIKRKQHGKARKVGASSFPPRFSTLQGSSGEALRNSGWQP